MKRSCIWTMVVLAAAVSALAESVVLEDYNGKGVLSGNEYYGSNDPDNSINKHPGYIRVKWQKGYAMYKSVGKKKIDLNQTGSISYDYRTTKKGEHFDADRAVELRLYVLEGVEKGYLFRYATDSLIDDGDWHRVCIPMSSFIVLDPKIPPKDKSNVYSLQIGINSYSQDKDKMEVDLKDIVAHSDAVDGVKQIPAEVPKDAGKATNP